MNISQIRKRITALRIQKGISEYQMSLELGKSASYIRSITSGRAVPSLNGLLDIIEYFEITPQQFFDTDDSHPRLTIDLSNKIKNLREKDAEAILHIIHQLHKQE